MPNPTAVPPVEMDATTLRRATLAAGPLSADAAAEAAATLKALSDPVRLRLLSLIAASGPEGACVCDLADHVEVAQSTISHHLKKLREAGLVDGARTGTWVHYRVLPTALARLSDLFAPTARRA